MIYFDNAATTYPKPIAVVRAAYNAIISYGGNPGRAGHAMSMRVSEAVFSVRRKAAEMFNTSSEQVIFTSNCTSALNTAIKGLVKDGDHVICSCLEHNSVYRPLYKLKKEERISFDIANVGQTKEDAIKSFSMLIKPNTKIIVCTAASNVTGRILPIAEIGELCREKGIIFIVDAAQSGGVLSIDMQAQNINALCLPGHKGLYGLTGTGLLLLNGISPEQINTVFEGGTGSLSTQSDPPDFFPDRLEAGTINTVGILALGAGIDFVKAKTTEEIYKHEFLLCKAVYEQLSKIDGIQLYSDGFEKGTYLPIVSFNIRGMNSEDTASRLSEAGFALRGGLHCSPLAHDFYGTLDMGMVRFSPSAFTMERQVVEFLKNIRQMSKNIMI